MGIRTAGVVIAATVAMTLLSGCDDGGGKKAAPATSTPAASSPATTTLALKYTAEQLKDALIEPPAGAGDVKTASGTFDEVLGTFSDGEPAEEVTADPGDASCGPQGDLDDFPESTTPAASLDFAQIEITSSVLLTARAGEGKPGFRPMPKACRTMKSRVGDDTITTKIFYEKPVDIGDGGWVTGTDQLTGGDVIRSWEVVFVAPGYRASATVFGSHVTRADAERLARRVFRKASATLK